MPPLRRLDTAGDAVRQVIRAYHGSPYDFDRFDASKIGTGEGAQAYGHGLYFAGNEATAIQYRDELKSMLDKEPPQDLRDEVSEAWRMWQDALGQEREWEDPASGLTNLAKHLYGEQNPHRQEVLALGQRWANADKRLQTETQNPGRVYEVEIGHPEDALLNWDRPTAPSGGVGARAAEVLRVAKPFDISASDLDYIKSVRPGGYAPPVYGSGIHSAEQSIRAMAQDPAGAAELRAAGIPGIKYLDGVSRQHGGGTRNYVMFPGTEDAIRILRKYGWAIPATLAADAAVNGSHPGAVAR